MNTVTNKESLSADITNNFGRSARAYHQEAEIQRKVANGLISSLRPWKDIIPLGPILEVGCGTGFLSELMVSEFPTKEIVITDASKEMLSFTKQHLGEANNRAYEVLNVDELEESEPRYSIIVCNFAAQWFSDTAIGLDKLSKLLLPGGLLLTAFPGNQSFMNWYECCLELGLPFTANPLPDVENVVIKLSLGPLQIDYYENDLYQEFEHSMDFFRHLKVIGASSSKTGKQLNTKQLKLLTEFWDNKTENQIKVKWHIVYLAAKKDMA